LTGPIFDKELRVASRRRRNYLLRFVYVAFFTFLLAMVWTGALQGATSSVYQSSRMAQAGLSIVAFVVWFQFVVCQVLAIIMLSTAISDEIYHKTLGVLMTTPVGSLQIVLGKLLSRLLQLVLLLAITFPLLAVVRVFGGVPWGFLVCAVCVTFTSLLFLGMLSLFFSIFNRRAYIVIINTFISATALYALLPLLAALLLNDVVEPKRIMQGLSYINPFIVLGDATSGLMGARGAVVANWAGYCGVTLGAAVVLLLLSTVLVRRAALRQATGQPGLFAPKGKAPAGTKTSPSVRLRRVAGPPVLWKEQRLAAARRWSGGRILLLILGIGLLLFTYALCAREDILDDEETHIGYVIVFAGLGLLLTAVLPPTCITSEKESRTWPLLLTTTVGDWDIVWGKLLGSLRRCAWAWIPLLLHLVIFALVGLIHPIALIQMLLVIAWLMIFLAGSGLYFSTRFRHTTAAVVANVALAACLWAIVPLLVGLILAISRARDDLIELYMDLNPFVQAVVITNATAQGGAVNVYDWCQGRMRDVGDATAWIVFNVVVYGAVGLVFVARATARLRRNPF
jgi:ABC-type transport system involved in multi-copper enzyme maturation permease subunit